MQALPRADRIRLVHLLIGDLACEEGIPLVEGGASYPIWTPYQAFDAAAVLQRALDAEGPKP